MVKGESKMGVASREHRQAVIADKTKAYLVALPPRLPLAQCRLCGERVIDINKDFHFRKVHFNRTDKGVL